MKRWSVVIPVYNEARYLPTTLASLLAQTAPVRIIVVDNGSTDDGIVAARTQAASHRADVVFLDAPEPGQVHALQHGITAVATELVAICDADTWYPPAYLATAERLFDARGEGCVVVAALLRPKRGGWLRQRLSALHRLTAARLMPRQNHTSGAAQCFRTAALRAAGGYDAARWPYVLKDHELMHRVLELGDQALDAAHWCVTSDRRVDRRAVRWTLGERLAYHAVPFSLKRRFFEEFLGPRFALRGQRDTVLRDRTWA